MSSTASSTVSTAPTGAAHRQARLPVAAPAAARCARPAAARPRPGRPPRRRRRRRPAARCARCGPARAGRRAASESRSASSSAAPWSSAAAPSTCPCRFDSRSRSAVSGLRSWWLASATNARCAASAPVTVSAIRSNDAESRRSSGGPLSSATGSAAPPARTARRDPAGALVEPAHRVQDPAHDRQGHEHAQRERQQHRRRRSAPTSRSSRSCSAVGGRDGDDGAAHLAVDQHRLGDHERRAVPGHLQRRRLRAAPGERRVEPLPRRRVQRRRSGRDGANGVPSAVTTHTDTPYTCR